MSVCLSLPVLVTAALLLLAGLAGWLAWRVAPARRRRFAPFRQPHKALVVLVDALQRQAGLLQAVGRHVEAAREAGLEVVCLRTREESASPDSQAGEPRALDFSGQVAAAPLFTVDSPDAFDCEEFAAFLLALQIDELYLAGGGPLLDVHATARSAMERGYKVGVLLDAIDVRGAEAAHGLARALAFAEE